MFSTGDTDNHFFWYPNGSVTSHPCIISVKLLSHLLTPESSLSRHSTSIYVNPVSECQSLFQLILWIFQCCKENCNKILAGPLKVLGNLALIIHTIILVFAKFWATSVVNQSRKGFPPSISRYTLAKTLFMLQLVQVKSIDIDYFNLTILSV